MAVVLVDGWPTDKVEEASRQARESGINIFFVTIEGPDENEKQNVVEPNFVDKVNRDDGHWVTHSYVNTYIRFQFPHNLSPVPS